MRYVSILAVALMLAACGMPEGTQRLACSDPAVTVVHDGGSGPFGNGKFCYGPK